MISFIKKAIEISYGKDYELIWKWPDITHDKLIKALNKVRGILNKMNCSIPIMNANFNGEYGPYSMNIANNSSINSLEGYRIVTVSPELRRQDYEDIITCTQNPDKIEMLVQGSVELMKTRYPILYGNENKRDYENYLIDSKNNRYPIHKSISGEELIVFDGIELSLLEEISHLKNLGYSNFSIDGRYKGDDYHKMVDIYKQALNGNINKKELEKYSPKNTFANY
jgi:putative protease